MKYQGTVHFPIEYYNTACTTKLIVFDSVWMEHALLAE